MTDCGAPTLDIFLHAVGPTGVSRNALAIAERMTARGWSVRVLCCRVADGFAVPSGVALQVLPDRGLPRWIGLARALPSLRRTLSAHRPDVFLSSGNHAHLTAFGASKGLKSKKAFRVSNDVDHGIPIIQRATSNILATSADLIVLVSGRLAQSPAFAPLVAEGRAHIIRNGVDLARVATGASAPCPHDWLHDGGGPVVITLARFSAQKNLGRLIAAMARVRETMPARLIILGGGNSSIRDEVLGRAKTLGLSDAVLAPGAVTDPFAWLSRADAFALPSLYEGSSNALLEALACGVPVVASRTAGDAPHVLGAGEGGEGAYGVLVDPLDEADIAGGILRQLGPDPVRPGDRASAFSLSATMDAYEATLTALLDRRGVAAAASPR